MGGAVNAQTTRRRAVLRFFSYTGPQTGRKQHDDGVGKARKRWEGGGFNKCQTGSETSSTLGRADGLGRHRKAKQGLYRNGVLVELLMKSSCCSFEDEGSFLGVRII